VEVLARAASEDAAWLAFQRMSAWWLGEHANVAANEFAGTSGVDSNAIEDEGVIKPPSGRVEIAMHNKPLSAGEVCLSSIYGKKRYSGNGCALTMTVKQLHAEWLDTHDVDVPSCGLTRRHLKFSNSGLGESD
jgi:hypothetical protein